MTEGLVLLLVGATLMAIASLLRYAVETSEKD
jgi:hypothetical protein